MNLVLCLDQQQLAVSILFFIELPFSLFAKIVFELDTLLRSVGALFILFLQSLSYLLQKTIETRSSLHYFDQEKWMPCFLYFCKCQIVSSSPPARWVPAFFVFKSFICMFQSVSRNFFEFVSLFK